MAFYNKDIIFFKIKQEKKANSKTSGKKILRRERKGKNSIGISLWVVSKQQLKIKYFTYLPSHIKYLCDYFNVSI